MDIDELVVRDGDRATATGRLVRNDRGDWFAPAFMIAEPGGLERRVRLVWQGAIKVIRTAGRAARRDLLLVPGPGARVLVPVVQVAGEVNVPAPDG